MTAGFENPSALVTVKDAMYVATTYAISRVQASTGETSVLVGQRPQSRPCFIKDSAVAAEVQFCGILELTTDGHYLYTLEYSASNASAIEATPRVVLRRVDLASGATSTIPALNFEVAFREMTGLTVGPGGFLYAASAGRLLKIDPMNAAIEELTAPINGTVLDLAADEEALWLLVQRPWTSDRQIRRFDLRTQELTDATGWLNGESLPAYIASAGAYLYTAGALVRPKNPDGTLDYSKEPQYPLARMAKADGSLLNIAYGMRHVRGLATARGRIHLADIQSDKILRIDDLPVLAPAPGERRAGGSPSTNVPQRCHCDPINTSTGELFESVSDLSLTGVGPSLAWTRTYSSSAGADDGPLGRGWTHSYAMSLAGTGASLADSDVVTVREENGSTVAFDRRADGSYSAPPRVVARLVRNSDGSLTFTRRSRQVFTFDASGRLLILRDLNGNALTLSYVRGRLDGVSDAHGRYLQVSWEAGRISRVADSAGRHVDYTYDAAGHLVDAADALGQHTTYGYDSAHRLTSKTLPSGGVVTTVYDSAGRAVSQSDPLGRTTTFAYDNGTVTVTSPSGAVTVERYTDGVLASETKGTGTSAEATWRYAYDVAGNITRATAPGGGVTSYGYDAQSNRVSATDPLGRTTTWSYDELGDVIRTVDPSGAVSTATFDSRGNQLSVTDPTGKVTRSTVNANGTISSTVDPRGAVDGADPEAYRTRFEYDAAGHRTAVITPTGARSTATYDHVGRLVSSTDPRGSGGAPGFTTTYTYDALDRVTTVTDPLGNTTATTYDADGNITTVTDALDRVTENDFDLAGQLTSAVQPDGGAISYAYDGDGNVTTSTNELGETTTTAYDALGRKSSITDELGRVTRFSYDADGNATRTELPSGAASTATYDKAGQLLTSTDPNGKTTAYRYDAAGRQTRVTDSEGRVTRLTYDRAGRVITQTRNDGTTVAWAYDSAGNELSYTDGAGSSTTHAYDADGKRVASTDADGRSTSFTYDLAGNLKATTAADGAQTTNAYDAANRLLSTDYSDTTPDVSLSYDAAGQLVTRVDGTGTTSYVYNPDGQLTAVDHPGQNVRYAHDNAGRTTAITYPSGRVVSYAYDSAGQLSSVNDGSGRITTYTWTVDGLTKSLTHPNGVVTGYVYDPAGQATALTITGPNSASLASFSYAYSPSGLLASATEAGEASTAPATRSYGYDALGQLASATSTPAAATDTTYTTSAAGHLTSTAAGTQDFTASGQLVATHTEAGDTTYTYDQRGNRTATTGPDGQLHYTYNAANQLTAHTATDGAYSHTYSADGLRATTTAGSGPSAQVEIYVWDRNRDVPTLLSDADHEYVYGLSSTPLEQIDTATDTAHYLHGELNGSVRAVTSAAGSLEGRASYDAYGNPNPGNTAAAITRFGYAGEYTDATGLIYLRARYYDPVTAQFITRDPLEGTTLNPYGYTEGDPLLSTDPLGLFCLTGSRSDGRCRGAGIIDAAVSNPVADVIASGLESGIGQGVSSALIGIGDGASGGLTSDLRNVLSPGAECYITKDGWYYSGIVGGVLAQAAVTGGGATAATSRIETSQVLLRSSRQLQAKFKHAADFGVAGNYSKSNAARFSSALHQHMNRPSTRVVPGTYRGESVVHYLDPSSALNVISRNGEFVSGWRLSSDQLGNVLKNGSLGGG
ncbi:colicin D domain-containing protein [Motilibacter aurantiacus]|uniref:colicin D domain-containing protein n=1 Tax=Motilibacter aurantiacus TaxID=2714955 RepID=UPI00140D8F08|nr:colicin D domain-containing protein [Motilibacter aurantiacus]NHC47648.1 hypothetical protein [Motilibacter aurantiacus]